MRRNRKLVDVSMTPEQRIERIVQEYKRLRNLERAVAVMELVGSVALYLGIAILFWLAFFNGALP